MPQPALLALELLLLVERRVRRRAEAAHLARHQLLLLTVRVRVRARVRVGVLGLGLGCWG